MAGVRASPSFIPPQASLFFLNRNPLLSSTLPPSAPPLPFIALNFFFSPRLPSFTLNFLSSSACPSLPSPRLSPSRYRMLSGCCCRALRLELQLQVAHLLHPLSRASHLCDGEDAKEVSRTPFLYAQPHMFTQCIRTLLLSEGLLKEFTSPFSASPCPILILPRSPLTPSSPLSASLYPSLTLPRPSLPALAPPLL